MSAATAHGSAWLSLLQLALGQSPSGESDTGSTSVAGLVVRHGEPAAAGGGRGRRL